MTPRPRDPHLLEHAGEPTRTVVAVGAVLRRPAAAPARAPGRSNFATSRSVNGAACSRASRTGVLAAAHLDPRARAAGRPSAARRTTARRRPSPAASTSTASTDVGRHHQRPGEQRVRADRHQQQRLDLGPDDRPAGGERVRRRAGRGRAARRRRSPSATAAGRRPRRRPRASARRLAFSTDASFSAQPRVTTVAVAA